MSVTYSVGFNMPGYLPESEPTTHSNYADARGALASELERGMEYMMDGENASPAAEEEFAMRIAHLEESDAEAMGEDIEYTMPDGYVYFLMVSED